MQRFRCVLPLAGLSVALYLILAWGATIYGSYRYEPSGIQYAFLPYVAAPICAVLAAGLVLAVRRAGAPWLLWMLAILAAVVLALPAFGMSLANRSLETARWATVLLAVVHAAVLAFFTTKVVRRSDSNPRAG